MDLKIDVITLGVNDLEQARRFYAEGLEATVRSEPDGLTVAFGGSASRLNLRDWDAVAFAAGVEPETSGFRAFTLSYILASADDVDRVLERAEQGGGRVTKPPKNAAWGYSAYVTDPSGYLWKVASSKRRPVFGRQGSSASGGRPISVQEVPLTIGVADMKRAKQFYKDGLGMPVKKAFGNKFVMFSGEDETSGLGMYKREALADDASVQPHGTGFHGYTLTHVVDSRERVDTLLARAERAGGEIIDAPTSRRGNGYSGHFADLDGNLWQVACPN
jgi:catechol 2,3-dioxygenase-like lactoylglutathione lyase family enzyme